MQSVVGPCRSRCTPAGPNAVGPSRTARRRRHSGCRHPHADSRAVGRCSSRSATAVVRTPRRARGLIMAVAGKKGELVQSRLQGRPSPSGSPLPAGPPVLGEIGDPDRTARRCRRCRCPHFLPPTCSRPSSRRRTWCWPVRSQTSPLQVSMIAVAAGLVRLCSSGRASRLQAKLSAPLVAEPRPWHASTMPLPQVWVDLQSGRAAPCTCRCSRRLSQISLSDDVDDGVAAALGRLAGPPRQARRPDSVICRRRRLPPLQAGSTISVAAGLVPDLAVGRAAACSSRWVPRLCFRRTSPLVRVDDWRCRSAFSFDLQFGRAAAVARRGRLPSSQASPVAVSTTPFGRTAP